MPNWCNNNLTVTSDDPEKIKRFNLALQSEGLFSAFLPNPTGAWDYAWSIENWGVKWDVAENDIQVIQVDEDRIIVEFDTPWSYPKEFLEHLESLGYAVYLMYHEPGLAFCGIYEDGVEDHYEYAQMASEEILATIPDDLDLCFGIYEQVLEREESNA